MLALAPTYLRLNDEMLDPMVARIFSVMLRRGLLSAPPEELAGMDINVEYISTMAQSMKMLGIGAIERGMTFVGNLSQAFPGVLDKVDADDAVENYFDMAGAPPSMVRDAKTVEEIRAKRAQDQQAQAMLASANSAADTAQKLSNANLGDNNALAQLMGRMQGGQIA